MGGPQLLSAQAGATCFSRVGSLHSNEVESRKQQLWRYISSEVGIRVDVEVRLRSHSRGRLIGSLGYILADLGRGTGPRGEKMAAACPGVDSQDLATILDPFRAIFADLGPDRLSET